MKTYLLEVLYVLGTWRKETSLQLKNVFYYLQKKEKSKIEKITNNVVSKLNIHYPWYSHLFWSSRYSLYVTRASLKWNSSVRKNNTEEKWGIFPSISMKRRGEEFRPIFFSEKAKLTKRVERAQVPLWRHSPLPLFRAGMHVAASQWRHIHTLKLCIYSIRKASRMYQTLQKRNRRIILWNTLLESEAGESFLFERSYGIKIM